MNYKIRIKNSKKKSISNLFILKKIKTYVEN